MLREGWSVHCLLEDAHISISPYVNLRGGDATLIRLLRYIGATEAEIAEAQQSIRQWHRGSVRVTLTPGRKNLLRIRAPWSERLDLR